MNVISTFGMKQRVLHIIGYTTQKALFELFLF